MQCASNSTYLALTYLTDPRFEFLSQDDVVIATQLALVGAQKFWQVTHYVTAYNAVSLTPESWWTLLRRIPSTRASGARTTRRRGG